MKTVFLFCLIGFAQIGYSQVLSGEIVDEKRKLTSVIDFKINDYSNGYAVFELAVDRNGNVTGARFIGDKSSKITTPQQVRAHAYVSKLKFQAGTYYPKFHHCLVRVNLVKQEKDEAK